MGFILPVIYIICFTYSLSFFLKKKFERLLPYTFIISALTLFLSQFIFKTFYVGVALNIGFALYFPIKLFLNHESLKSIKEKYLTNGVIAFLILYAIVYIIDFNRFFTRWDELSHWGKMVKEMWKLDSFYSVPASNLLVHKDYPPIMSLMELFYSMISGGFKEVYLIRCMHLFEGTLILACLKFDQKTKKEVAFKTIISLIIIYFMTFFLDTAIVINSIYTDYVLALFVAFAFFQMFKTKEFTYSNLFLLSLSCIFLLLSKQVAIAFYLMIIAILMFMVIFNKEKWQIKKIGIALILIIGLPLASLFTWNRYIDSIGIVGQFEVQDIHLDTLLPIIKGTSGEEWQLETVKNYQSAIVSKSITNSHISISYAQFAIITLFLGIILTIIIKEKKEKKKNIALTFILLGGFIGYTILMLILYIYSFGEAEGPILASFDRYMSTYCLICLYTLFYIYIKQKDIQITNKLKYILVIFILCLVIKPSALIRLRPDLIILNNHFYDSYKEASKTIDDVVNDQDKVFIIDQNEKNGAVFYINYFSNKISTNLKDYSLPINLENSQETFYINYYNHIKDYNYLYTYDIDEDFINQYSFLTNKRLENKKLYKINLKDNIIKLEEVN